MTSASPKWTPGQFVWRELGVTDVDRAKGYFNELFGWTYKDAPMGPDFVYTMIVAGEQQVGGLYKPSPKMPALPTTWFSYLSVPDVDRTAGDIKAAGGKVLGEPMDIPGVGRFVMAFDPQGAIFAPFRSLNGDPEPVERPAVGTFCWETLSTSSLEGARTFYERAIGWTPGAGPGDAVVFNAGQLPIADVQATAPGAASSWMPHVLVDKLEATRDKARRLGAQILAADVPVPGMGRLAVVQDPFGATLGLFEGST
jgi:predicted enzyme related to lactoylglutathione lyase